MSEINYDNPLVSVVIPSFKIFNSLSKTIESVQSQTYKNIEIIVVDIVMNYFPLKKLLQPFNFIS